MKYSQYMKKCFKITEKLAFNDSQKFQQALAFFDNIIRKIKKLIYFVCTHQLVSAVTMRSWKIKFFWQIVKALRAQSMKFF